MPRCTGHTDEGTKCGSWLCKRLPEASFHQWDQSEMHPPAQLPVAGLDTGICRKVLQRSAWTAATSSLKSADLSPTNTNCHIP